MKKEGNETIVKVEKTKKLKVRRVFEKLSKMLLIISLVKLQMEVGIVKI